MYRLSFPWQSFSGKYRADVSTVNKAPAHFDPNHFQPNNDIWGKDAVNGWWNPNVIGAW